MGISCDGGKIGHCAAEAPVSSLHFILIELLQQCDSNVISLAGKSAGLRDICYSIGETHKTVMYLLNNNVRVELLSYRAG